MTFELRIYIYLYLIKEIPLCPIIGTSIFLSPYRTLCLCNIVSMLRHFYAVSDSTCKRDAFNTTSSVIAFPLSTVVTFLSFKLISSVPFLSSEEAASSFKLGK